MRGPPKPGPLPASPNSSVMEKLMKNMKILPISGVVWLFMAIPGYATDKVTLIAKSTESAKAARPARLIKFGDTVVDMDRLETESQRLVSLSLGSMRRSEKEQSGKDIEVRYDRRAKYFPKNKHVAIIESKILGEEVSQGYLKVYRDDGVKIFETHVEPDKSGDYLDYEDDNVKVLGNHHVITIASKYIGENKRWLDVYTIDSGEVVFSTPANHVKDIRVSPDENYVLLYIEKEGDGTIYKYDLLDQKIKKIMGNATLLDISNDGKSYALARWVTGGQNPLTGNEMGFANLYLYKGDMLIWTNRTKSYEVSMGGGWDGYSVGDKYYIYCRAIDVIIRNNRIESSKTLCSIFNTENGRIAVEGELGTEIIEKYKNENTSNEERK